LLDAPLGLLSHLAAEAIGDGGFTCHEDHAERVLEVVDNGARETSEQRKPLGIEHLLHELTGEVTHALAEGPKQGVDELGRLLHHFHDLIARDKQYTRVGHGGCTRRARRIIDDGHLAKKIACFEFLERMGLLS
jgi:hypothetical protein